MTKKSKKILRILAWTLLGVLVLFGLLHTPPARNLVKGVLSRVVAGSAEGSLDIGRITYNLLQGTVTLRDIRFENPLLRAEADRIDASLYSRNGVTLEAPNIRVVLLDTSWKPRRAGKGSSPPWQLLRHVAFVSVEKAGLEWGEGPGAGAIEGALKLDRGGTEGRTREDSWLLTGGIEGRVGDFSLVPLILEAAVSLQQEDLSFDEIQIRAAGAILSVRGIFFRDDTITGSLSGSFQIEESLIKGYAPDLPVQDEVTGSFQLDIEDSGRSNRIGLDIPELFVAGSGPWDLRADSRLEGKVWHIDSCEAAGYQGSLVFRGAVDFDREEIQAEVEAQGLDVSSLASVWAELPVPIASRLGAEARFSMKGWDAEGAEARGQLRIDAQGAEGAPVSGSLDFELSGGRLAFDSSSLRMFESRLEFSGEMSGDALQARYTVEFPISDLARFSEVLDLPALPVEAEGSLSVAGEVKGDAQDVTATARAQSDGLRIQSEEYGIKVELELDRETIIISEAEVLAESGTMSVEGRVPIGSAGQDWALLARLEAFDLADLTRDIGIEIPVGGKLEIRGKPGSPVWLAAFQAPFIDGERSSRVGALSLKASGQGNDARLEELKVELGDGSLSASGHIQLETGDISGQVGGSGIRLEDLTPLANELEGLGGTATLEAGIQGSLSSPEIELSLGLTELSTAGYPIPDFSLSLESKGDRAELTGSFREPFLNGSCVLEGSFPLQFEVDVASLPIPELLAGFRETSSLKVVTAAGQVRLDLSLLDPSTLKYEAEVEAVAGVQGGRDWQIPPFSVKGDLEAVHVNALRLIAGEDKIEIDGRLPLGADGEVDLQVKGAMDLGLLDAVLPGGEFEGEADIQLHIHGFRDQPRSQGEATVSLGQGSWEGFTWESLDLRLSGSEEGIRLDTLSLNSLGGSMNASGQLLWTDSGFDGRAAFSLDRMDLGRLFGEAGAASSPVFRVSGEGELQASEPSLAGLKGSGILTLMEADVEGSSASLQSPVEWNIESGSFSHSPVHFMGDKIDFHTTLSFDAGTTPPDWSLEVQGKVDPGLANAFIDDSNIHLSGEMDVNFDLRSREGKLLGRASLEGGRVRLLKPSLTVSRLQMQVSLQEQLLEIIKMQGEAGTGQIGITGRLTPEESGRLTKADFRIQAVDVPLILSDGIFGRFSGEMRLNGGSENYTLKGSVSIPRIVFRQELEPGSESLVLIERQLESLDEEASLLELIVLDLRAEIGELQVDNSMAQLSADGILTLRGDLLTPRIDGSVRIKKGGTVEIGRGLVRIEEGRVTLDGYPEIPLELTFIGMTRIGGTVIELDVRGRTDNLQTQISAPYDSNLTQGDLAVLLMTGRMPSAAVNEAGTVVTEELAAGLGSILQGQVGEKVYIDFSADQSLFSYGSDPTTRFSVGHMVAPNLYIIYSTSLKGTQTRGLLDYQPPQPFRVRYIVEEDGRHILEANHTLGVRLKRQAKSGTGEAGRQSRIHTLSFEGESPLTEKELRKLSKLKPGKRYDYWGAFQAAERIRSKLVKLGFRSALVDVEEHPLSSGEMDVVFALETGKRIHIVWTGDVPGKRFRKRIEALWDGRLSEDMLADTLARRAEYALRAEKYFQARVTPSLEETGEEITIRFDVAEGNIGQRIVLIFEGNDSLPEAKLEGVLPKRNTADFFAAVGEETSMLRRAIHVLYASEGFLRGRVTDIRTSYSEHSREFLVTIVVDEGPRAMVASVSLPPEAAEYKGANAPHLDLVPDTPFRIEDYMNARTELYGFYSGEGYSQPQVSGILKPVDDKIAVLFTVEKGPLARVGEIRMARPSRIRQSRLEKLLTLKEGDQILPTELALSRTRLFETRAFQSVDIQTVASEEGPDVRDVVVDLIDKPEVEVNYGLRYTLLNPTYLAESGEEKYSPFEVGGSLLFVNPFGFGHRYGASGYVFGKTQFYRLFHETDTFFGLRFPTQVILSQDWLQELQLSRVNSRINRITFQQHYLWGERTESLVGGERLRLQWNYSFRHIRLTYVDENIPAYDTDRGSISLSLIGDTRDSFVDPARGSFWSVTSEFASQWLASDVNFTKIFVQGYFFIPLGERTVWASGLRIGAVPGDNPLLIIEDRFRAGGVYSVRGFPLNYLGPKNDLGEPLGGQAVLIFNQELRFPLYRSLFGGAFYDTGNVFALADLMRLGDLRHCAGLGLRYMLPFGPIRLDWAYVLDPKPGEDKYRFSFTIGHVF